MTRVRLLDSGPGSPAGIPRDLLQRLVCSLGPDAVILFGSRARNQARAHSDIDLLLVGTWSIESVQMLRRARQLVRNSFPRVDLVICSQEEIEAARAGQYPFLSSILASGVVIYDRRPVGRN